MKIEYHKPMYYTQENLQKENYFVEKIKPGNWKTAFHNSEYLSGFQKIELNESERVNQAQEFGARIDIKNVTSTNPLEAAITYLIDHAPAKTTLISVEQKTYWEDEAGDQFLQFSLKGECYKPAAQTKK